MLPNFTTGVFGLFLKFIYQGTYSMRLDQSASNAGIKIPPSAHAWLMGSVLGARSFQNHAMHHIYKSIGKLFVITPELIEWCMENTEEGSQLRQLFMDTLIVHWNRNTHIVARSGELDELWEIVFDKHTELRRLFIFGLKGETRLADAHSYFIFTQEEAKKEIKESAEVIKEENVFES